eukprot:TRINITY_DN30974_c0_g1_i1.p2 TRINITY_DN30974_c0_g1~~TRINITY_DN30974_c0_g1_i1.p2  ORF type:complete len:129 (+),score=8.96 TRINITY_DN30974_c0_g1_i1:54-389(+)
MPICHYVGPRGNCTRSARIGQPTCSAHKFAALDSLLTIRKRELREKQQQQARLADVLQGAADFAAQSANVDQALQQNLQQAQQLQIDLTNIVHVQPPAPAGQMPNLVPMHT